MLSVQISSHTILTIKFIGLDPSLVPVPFVGVHGQANGIAPANLSGTFDVSVPANLIFAGQVLYPTIAPTPALTAQVEMWQGGTQLLYTDSNGNTKSSFRLTIPKNGNSRSLPVVLQ